MRSVQLTAKRIVDPVISPQVTRSLRFMQGADDLGDFVACRLSNQERSMFFGWYVLVSPDDHDLMLKYEWFGHLSGKAKHKHINVRRREMIQDIEVDILLNKVIWERMSRVKAPRVYLLGHPLDFRRQNLSLTQSEDGCRGVIFRDGGWQVQIGVKGRPWYVGRASTREEGCRMFNRRLRELKAAHPDDPVIQAAPYNNVQPLF